MEFNTRRELYDYLNNFDFNSIRETTISSVYFLIEFDDHIEPIYFMRFEGVWFESPCCLRGFPLEDNQLMAFVEGLYEGNSIKESYEYEKTLQKDGWHYDIDVPQCAPFLPDKIKIIDVFSDRKCLEWLLSQKNTE